VAVPQWAIFRSPPSLRGTPGLEAGFAAPCPRNTLSYTDALTWFARGLGAARLGQLRTAIESAEALHQIHDRLVTTSENYWARQVEIQGVSISAWAALAQGKKEDALRLMKSAAWR
jgi:hypothetical protein